MQDKIAQSERLAMQVSINSIIVNLILSVGKLAAGILANSAAMISDAIHPFRRLQYLYSYGRRQDIQ